MTDSIFASASSAVALTRARRAIGAMFFSIFGGVWIGYWANRVFDGSAVVLAIVVVAALVLTGAAYNRYRTNSAGLAEESETPAVKKINRLFHLVNGGQWVIILIAANVLPNIGLAGWVLPVAIFVIGLHFLPLAYLFSNRPHYITGAAMMLLAVIYPFLASGGPTNPIGCLGAGLILWASSIWAITATPTIVLTAQGVAS